MNSGDQQQSFEIDKKLEKEWWQLLKSGDKTALSAIYNTFVNGMFGYGMSIIADKDLVRDCIQEVFIDLWKYRSNLANTDNIKFYVYKSLRNKIYTLSTKEKRKKALDNENMEVALIPSHEDVLINDQRNSGIQHKLVNCIENLPERQREVIRHIYFENHSYEETSNLMEINIRSVYTLAWKALSSLRKSVPKMYILLCLLPWV